MKLLLNGEDKEINIQPLTITDLIKFLEIPLEYTAVEVNKEIIPRTQFDSFSLNDGDQVEVVRFVGGGKK